LLASSDCVIHSLRNTIMLPLCISTVLYSGVHVCICEVVYTLCGCVCVCVCVGVCVFV
jgi:hypothetical protein